MKSSAAVDHLSYWLDSDDVIVAVDRGFALFAASNDAPALAAQVVGRPIWDFVAGVDVRALWRHLLARARTTPEPMVRVECRCDSPTERRLIQLDIARASEGTIEIRSHIQLLDARTRATPAQSSGADCAGLLHACSWCNRFRLGDTWIEADELVARLRLLGGGPVPAVSHGVCSRCAHGLELELGWRPPRRATPVRPRETQTTCRPGRCRPAPGGDER